MRKSMSQQMINYEGIERKTVAEYTEKANLYNGGLFMLCLNWV